MNFRIAWLGLSLAALPAAATDYNIHEELRFAVGSGITTGSEIMAVTSTDAGGGKVHTLAAHLTGNLFRLAAMETHPGNTKKAGRTYTMDGPLNGGGVALAKTVADGTDGNVLDVSGGTFTTISGPSCTQSGLPICRQGLYSFVPFPPPNGQCLPTDAQKSEGDSMQASASQCPKTFGTNDITHVVAYADGT